MDKSAKWPKGQKAPKRGKKRNGQTAQPESQGPSVSAAVKACPLGMTCVTVPKTSTALSAPKQTTASKRPTVASTLTAPPEGQTMPTALTAPRSPPGASVLAAPPERNAMSATLTSLERLTLLASPSERPIVASRPAASPKRRGPATLKQSYQTTQNATTPKVDDAWPPRQWSPQEPTNETKFKPEQTSAYKKITSMCLMPEDQVRLNSIVGEIRLLDHKSKLTSYLCCCCNKLAVIHYYSESCKHLFCDRCIGLATRLGCPKCGAKPRARYQNPIFEKELLRLRAQCPYVKYGCRKIVMLYDLVYHLGICRYSDEPQTSAQQYERNYMNSSRY